MQAKKTGRDVGSLSCFKQIIFPMEPGPMQSTNQADFINHTHFIPEKLAVKDTSSILTKDQVEGKFQGLTCYLEDYAKKSAMRRPTPLRPTGPVYARHFLQHAGCDKFATTYGEHFAPREHEDGGKGLTVHSQSSSLGPFRYKPFEGQTSYTQHFPKPEIIVSSATRTGGDNQSTLTEATRACIFDSHSIYQESFLKHRMPGKRENLRPLGALHGGQAFSGSSEYKTVFTTWPRLEKWR
mmetsp:Transcript_21573/g.26570  ORF Transcript_21573/g.26570 Transcript_21573/m.26570 type:complete len:239 (-) Transcript_21573:109-825(-)